MPQLQAQTTARLKTRYEEEIRPALIERFGYSSPMQAPKIQKITLNMGIDAQAGLEDHRGGDQAAVDDRRPAAEHPPGAQVDRRVQAARGHAGRHLGDAAA